MGAMQGNVAKNLWLAEEKTGFKESLSSHEECHLHTSHGYMYIRMVGVEILTKGTHVIRYASLVCSPNDLTNRSGCICDYFPRTLIPSL